MKNFSQLEFNPRICREELAEFQQLLQNRQSLSELDDISPFFRKRQHLAAFVAFYHPKIIRYNLIAGRRAERISVKLCHNWSFAPTVVGSK
ncbi:MAG: hypothetical protein GDA43_11400 [Hormoscilla sp. SP5CHS1]|nr:hypothetical protein [Hormoscilla sp. SP12CHS1]MBC6453740.1 hypothetical protein [Hormoscilla sp. SP5CHS1]